MAGDTGNHVYRGERKPNGEKTHSAYTVLSQPALCLPVFITRAAFNFFQSILIAPPICTQT